MSYRVMVLTLLPNFANGHKNKTSKTPHWALAHFWNLSLKGDQYLLVIAIACQKFASWYGDCFLSKIWINVRWKTKTNIINQLFPGSVCFCVNTAKIPQSISTSSSLRKIKKFLLWRKGINVMSVLFQVLFKIQFLSSQ